MYILLPVASLKCSTFSMNLHVLSFLHLIMFGLWFHTLLNLKVTESSTNDRCVLVHLADDGVQKCGAGTPIFWPMISAFMLLFAVNKAMEAVCQVKPALKCVYVKG